MLKARTTYINGNGEKVHIGGLALYQVEGQDVFWSIQGDHYARDGRFVTGRPDKSYKKSLVSVMSGKTIRREDDSAGAAKWWEGVAK